MTRMSKTVTLVLLSAAMLTTCCCCLNPWSREEEQRVDENGNPVADSTHSTTSGGRSTHSSFRRSTSLWPLLGGSSYRSSPSYSSPSNAGTTTRGGFGSSGSSFGGSSAS